ncbi:uncharacterized protein METZ01_LOCUS235847, partial [marine metagenome]
VEFSNEALNIKAVYKESILNPELFIKSAPEEVEEDGLLKSITDWFKKITS